MADDITEESSKVKDTYDDNKTRHCFALYRCISTRGKHCVNSSGDSDNGSANSPQKPSKIPVEFSLNIVACNLDAERETQLRTLVSRKLSKGSTYPGSGCITSVDFSSDGEEGIDTFECYYCLLRQSSEILVAIQSSLEKVPCTQEFVVCFLHKEEGTMDIFRHELDKYCAELLPFLDSEKEFLQDDQLQALETEIRPHLGKWHHSCLEFISRVIQLLGTHTTLLLHGALLNSSIHVEGTSQEEAEDITKFLNCCQLSELMTDSKSNSRSGSISPETSSKSILVDLTSDQLQNDQPKLTVCLNKKEWAFSDERCNRYCVDWAKALIKGDQENAVYLKQIIDSYKLKAIQDMNTFRRMIRQAESDHYALYRAFHFLQTSGNCDILLHHAQVSDHTRTSSSTGVLKILDEYSKETSTLER